jgi:enamine deaminase RidA (YjgF/YER057c/UK114 family)
MYNAVMVGPAKGPGAPGANIPDLDVGVASSRSQPRPSRASSVEPQSVVEALEPGLDDDLLGSGYEQLSLNTDASDEPRSSKLGEPGTARRAWPTGVTPEAGSVPSDAALLKPLCSWGKAPEQWWQAPRYAFSVYQGQRNLTSQAEPIARQLAQAEQQRDACLAALGSRLRDSVSDDRSFIDALQAVDASDALSGHASEQLQQAQTTFSTESEALEQAILLEQQKLKKAIIQQQEAQQQFEDAEMALRRVQARLQRAHIEQRNLEQSQAPEGEVNAKLTELQALAESLAPQIAAAERAAADCRRFLGDAGAAVDQIKAQLAEHERTKAGLGRSLSAKIQQASSVAEGAVEQQQKALANLGRAILASCGRVPVDDATLDELVRCDQTIKDLWLRNELYRQALDNYDRAAVKRGIRLMIGLVALVIALFVWRIIAAD